jgi:DNA polymerase III epsilon subunit-like protein
MTSYHNKWRKFLSEQASPITKLRIFDFDETIAYTTSEVRAVDPEGRKFRFPNQHVWDNFLKQFRGKTTNELEQEGWRFDFSDFSEVRNPKENKRITQIVSYLIQANKNDRHRQLYVLTARGSDSQGPIRDYLKTINLHPDEFEGVIGLAGGSKKDAIKKMIEDHGGSVRSVHFFDDSHKNIDDVKQLEKDFPNIEFRIVHVSPEGIQKVNEEKFADYHAPFVDNKEDVEKTLNKKVRWLGKHPEGKYPGYDGWYSRDIGGHREMKILLGNPPGVESKTPTIKEDVQPASFYPSRFDNLLKLLDENKDKIWVFFDTETTGLEYENEEVQITEIACASYDPKGFIEEPEEVGTFDIKISLQPETKAAMKKQTRGQTGRNPTIRDLLKMTGYGSKGVPYVQPAEALDRFEAFLDEMRSKSPSGEIMMVAQNAAFDVGIINQLYFRIDREPPGDVSFDTKAVIENHLMPVVRELMKVPEEERTAQDNQIIRSLVQGKQISGSLGKMLSAFDIKNKGWHSAIADVQMTMEMMYNIVKYLRTKSSRLRNKTSFRQFEPLGGDPVYGFRGPKKGQIPNRTK